MTYRVLEISEWGLVEPEFVARNQPMPDPRFAMIVAAFEDGDPEVQGFLVAQLQIHTEPLVVKNLFTIRGLVSTMEEELKSRLGTAHYYCFADGNVAKIAEHLGLQRVNMDIYHKVIE